MLYIDRQNGMLTQALKKQKTFQIGDIVGVKIAKVDRSNTAPSILPCKIIRIASNPNNHQNRYSLASADGIISTAFTSADLIDLTQTTSTELRNIDPSTLPEISIIQASHTYTKYRTITACKCSKTCANGRCPCKKRRIPCCSKCHGGKNLPCSNANWSFATCMTVNISSELVPNGHRDDLMRIQFHSLLMREIIHKTETWKTPTNKMFLDDNRDSIKKKQRTYRTIELRDYVKMIWTLTIQKTCEYHRCADRR